MIEWAKTSHATFLLRYIPARLDQPESGTIAKILVRSSTAVCFKNFNFYLELLKGVQSSKPFNTKIYLIP
jgi:hypothetical protein